MQSDYTATIVNATPSIFQIIIDFRDDIRLRCVSNINEWRIGIDSPPTSSHFHSRNYIFFSGTVYIFGVRKEKPSVFTYPGDSSGPLKFSGDACAEASLSHVVFTFGNKTASMIRHGHRKCTYVLEMGQFLVLNFSKDEGSYEVFEFHRKKPYYRKSINII